MPDLGHGAIAIIGHGLNEQRDAARAIAFVRDLFIVHAFFFAGAAPDGAIDRFIRHVAGLGVGNRLAQTRVGIRVAAARARRDRQFLDEFGKEFPALGIERALLMLNRMPFRMS